MRKRIWSKPASTEDERGRSRTRDPIVAAGENEGETMAGKPMTHDELVEKLRKADLRKTWSNTKTKVLALVKKDSFYKDAAKALEKQFDQGLGPALDKWTAELNKYPKWSLAKLFSIRNDITEIMKKYIKAIEKAGLNFKDELTLKGMLEALDEALAKNWKLLDEAGKK
jgi:hypothetical protein